MKKLWKKMKQAFAWVGALVLAGLAVAASVLLLRKKDEAQGSSKEALDKIFKKEKELEKAKIEAQEASYALSLEEAKQETEEKARKLERSADDLAAALTSLSDD